MLNKIKFHEITYRGRQGMYRKRQRMVVRALNLEVNSVNQESNKSVHLWPNTKASTVDLL